MAFPLIGAGITAAVGLALRPAIGWLIAALGVLFRSRFGTWAAAALAYFGLAWSTQSFVVGPVLDQVEMHMTGVSGDAVQWLGYLNFDRACTMILSAVAIRFGIQAGKAFLARR